MLLRVGGGTFASCRSRATATPRSRATTRHKINAAYAFGGATLQSQDGRAVPRRRSRSRRARRLRGLRELHRRDRRRRGEPPRQALLGDLRRRGNGQAGSRFGPGEETLDGEKGLASRAPGAVACPAGQERLRRSTTTTTSIAPPPSRRSSGIKGRLTSPLRLPINFLKGPIIGWDAPQAFVTDMGALTMPQLVLSAAIGGEATPTCSAARRGRPAASWAGGQHRGAGLGPPYWAVHRP